MKLDESTQMPLGLYESARSWLQIKLQEYAREINKRLPNLTSTAMPSTGSYAQGDFVRKDAPSVTGSGVLVGWLRLTDGSSHTLNTDWVECIVPTVSFFPTAGGVALRVQNAGTAISSLDDSLGVVEFYSNDASANSTGVFGRVGVYNEFSGSWDGTASRVDTYMAFSTTVDGAMTEVMRLRSDGAIVGTNLLRLRNAGSSVASADQSLGDVEFYSNDASANSTGVFGKISVANENGSAWDGTLSRVDTYMSFWTTTDAAMTEKLRITSDGSLIARANGTAPTLGTNGQMTFELTSNTELKIKVRGSDGTTRSVSLTLA